MDHRHPVAIACVVVCHFLGALLITACSSAPPVQRAARRSPPGNVVKAPPPTLRFSEADLGTPYDGRFIALQGADAGTLFPHGTLRADERTSYDADVFVIDDSQQFLAHAQAWFVAGSLEEKRHYRFAGYRALEIQRCVSVDDRTKMNQAPRHAVYYPASVCFGYRYEAVLEGNENSFDAGVRAELLSGLGASIESFANRHKLRFRAVTEGLRRKGDCSTLHIKDETAFEACFEPSSEAPTPVLVEWRVIPGRQPASAPVVWKDAKAFSDCGGVQPDCKPCQEWQFEEMSFDSGQLGLEVVVHVTEPGGAQHSYRGQKIDLTKRPILAIPDDVVDWSAEDEDLFFNDPLGRGRINIGAYHRNGEAAGGRLTLRGHCVRY